MAARLEWPKSIKLLHFLISVFMTFELMSELDMKAIWKRKGELHFRHILFHAHMWVGMAMAVVIALFWLQIYYNEQVRAHLFPYRGTYLQNICVDITGMIKGCFPESGLRGGLPGLIQGVGLLAGLFAVLSGWNGDRRPCFWGRANHWSTTVSVHHTTTSR